MGRQDENPTVGKMAMPWRFALAVRGWSQHGLCPITNAGSYAQRCRQTNLGCG